ncbi:MAG: ribose 5-phosphate isomerase B [Candidatus Acidiferrales bacterium]
MPRSVFTFADLEKIPTGGEVSVPPGALITALAADEAARRSITIKFTEPSAESGSGWGSAHTQGRAVAIGADHGGYELKEQLKRHLSDWAYTVIDLGTSGTDPVDYPDFAEAVANAVAHGQAWRGVVIDSAGIGSAIAANKVPGARAALCYDRATARNSREHNDANVITFGARLIPAEVAREILALWLDTPFAGGRHQRRIDKIKAIEDRNRTP